MSKVKIFSMNTARICIDQHQETSSGRVYSKLWPTPLIFSGLGEMLLGMDQLFDKCGYPQAFNESRSFLDHPKRSRHLKMPEPQLKDEEMGRQRGKCHTFDLVIQSRRMSGWQGILMDPDRTKIVHFDSEMELLNNMCEILDAKLLTG